MSPTIHPPSVKSSGAALLRAEPFLHLDPDRIYNPLNDRALHPGETGYEELRGLVLGTTELPALPPALRQDLREGEWIVPADTHDPGTRFHLKYVSLEAHTVCNQACYFCPVSVSPRQAHFMTMDFYDAIARQLADYRSTLEGVSMINYNEPTTEKLFLDRVRVLKRYELPPAVLTNGSGLTPKRIDALLEMGGLQFLSVNLSTLDRQRYQKDRQGDHLDLVLRNLDYLRQRRLAPAMEIAVLGPGDETHRRDFADISSRFAGSLFEIKFYEVMDRASNVPLGLRPAKPVERLCGCEQTGSRPLQWVHITPHGQCVLCCQDYHERYVVGDLNKEPLAEILSGAEMAKLRRWVYGLEQAPDDFICRNCIYALSR